VYGLRRIITRQSVIVASESGSPAYSDLWGCFVFQQPYRPKFRKGKHIMRFAGYIRVSKEEPEGGFSLDSQRNLITRRVKAYDGKLVHIYSDESMSGRSTDRTQLQQLLRDAQKGLFDAVIVQKFDRLNRNRLDALAIKSFLRYDLGLKVLSVSEPSEDSDGDDGAFVEGMMECVAEWYLVNLSGEASKAKRERAMQGLHNNQAPFGMTKDQNKVLIPDENELPGLIMIFETYASGLYAMREIALMLNEKG
jgi:site-specific DNA recombinase